MITKTLSTIKGKVRISVPENLNELTVGQLLAIQSEEMNDLKALAFLSGCSETDIANIPAEKLSDIWERWLSLAHQIQYCYQADAIPKTIVFGKKKVKVLGLFYVERDNVVKVMHNLSIEPAGAFMACRNIIADEINKHINLYGEENWKENFVPGIDCIAQILGHYFYCKATGNLYIEQLAEEFKSEVLKLSVQEALPIGRHFFLRYPDLLKQKISLWDRLRVSWRNALALHRLKSSRSIIR